MHGIDSYFIRHDTHINVPQDTLVEISLCLSSGSHSQICVLSARCEQQLTTNLSIQFKQDIYIYIFFLLYYQLLANICLMLTIIIEREIIREFDRYTLVVVLISWDFFDSPIYCIHYFVLLFHIKLMNWIFWI